MIDNAGALTTTEEDNNQFTNEELALVAVEQARLSDNERELNPYVGVVIARNGQILGKSYRGRTGEGEHAEYGLFRELQEKGVDLQGAKLFATLEPCSSRNHPKKPCADHIINAGIAEVWIGMYDPNPRIYRQGWKRLNEAGIELRDFPYLLREEIKQMNAEFRSQYLTRQGQSGHSICFDYKQNGGRFAVSDDSSRFQIEFSSQGADNIYLYGGIPGVVATPRFAQAFIEVDDPDALDWGNYFVDLEVGSIGITRNESGWLLLKITEVRNMDRGHDEWKVCFDYEIRKRST